MNFSSLRENFVDKALRDLRGHGVPGSQPRATSLLPALTNQDVSRRLGGDIPDLVAQIQGLHVSQKTFLPTNRVDKQLKVFCSLAGQSLVRACTVLEELVCELRTKSSCATFSQHESLLQCLLEVDGSLDVWAESIGANEFYGRHARSQNARFAYIAVTIRLVLVIVDLTFSEEWRDYVDELANVIGRSCLQSQFFFDGPGTYRDTKEARVGITALLYQTPKRFVPYGMTEMTPFWVHNLGTNGHRLLPNELCINKLKAPPAVYLNLGRYNPWDVK